MDIKKLLQKEEYGFLPCKPSSMSSKIIETIEGNYLAGKGTYERVKLSFKVKNKTISFPINFVYQRKKKAPTIICLNFRSEMPDRYIPMEEIIDLGWNIVSVNYNDITSDANKLDKKGKSLSFKKDYNYLLLRGKEDKSSPGKIMMWAWGGMRILDYLLTRNEVDKKNVAICGHSRLGKASLVAAAYDGRFKFVHSNCSGTCGASLFKDYNDKSEHIEQITNMFPYWFCDNFKKYSTKNLPPFDQDDLVKLIAPRICSISSATEDAWANPVSEFNCVKKASIKWGKNYHYPKVAKVGEVYHQYPIGYFLREGRHFFSRHDWVRFLNYFNKNLNK